MPSPTASALSTSVYSRLCWDCISKQRGSRSDTRSAVSATWRRNSNSRYTVSSRGIESIRRFHNGRRARQEAVSVGHTPIEHDLPPELPQREPIRKRLARWQEENGNPLSDLIGLDTAFGIRNVVADTHGEIVDKNKAKDPDNDVNQEDGIPTAQYDQDLSETGGMYSQMGDLVELKPARNHLPPTIGVFVRTLASSRQCQVITLRGKWTAVDDTTISFSVPGFMDKKLVEPVVPFLPDAEVMEEVLGQSHIIDPSVPRTITAPIVTALNHFYQASEEVYRKHASVLDNAHDALAHATDLRFGTLDRITDRLIGQKTDAPRMAAMYAVRKALITGGGMGFGVDRRSHRLTGVFQIRSKEQLQYVTTAIDWLREYQEYELGKRLYEDPNDARSFPPPLTEGAKIVQSFVDKAKTMITDSRKHRSAEYLDMGAIGPSKKRYPLEAGSLTLRFRGGVSFDDNDRVLIRVLEYAGVQNILMTEDSLQSLLPLILRGTGMYSEGEFKVTLGKRAVYAFLLELGVFAPFEDMTHYDVNLLLPSSQHSKPLQQLATTLDNLSTEKVDLKDNFRDLRKDYGGRTAFAIDSEDSKEIDDAISVERIPGTESKAWLHVHIANPTAFLGRDSVFARMAAHLTESFYAPDRTVPLLPSWLTQQMFSLATGRPCLTISALLDERGDILDVKLEHGKLGTVVHMPYTQLPKQLGVEVEGISLEPMVLGGQLPKRSPSKPVVLTAEQRADLLFINKFSQARVAHRIRNGGFPYAFGQPDVSVHVQSDKQGIYGLYPRRKRAIRVDGDPIIAVYPKPYENPFESHQQDHTALVQEMMLLAGEAFSRWCHQRDIPLAYRSMSPLPGAPSYQEAYDVHIKRAIDKVGHIPVGTGFRFLQNAGMGSMLTHPEPHPALGLKAYSKITSPLRRYGDMISHWQAEAALREEARHGHNSLLSRTALSPQRHDYLPFNHTQMQNIISRLQPRERLIGVSKNRSQRHWISQWFFRAFYFQEYPLPPTMRIIVLREASKVQSVRKPRIMCCWIDNGLILKSEPEGPDGELLQYGDIWEAEIGTVVPFYPDTLMKPLRLVHREELF